MRFRCATQHTIANNVGFQTIDVAGAMLWNTLPGGLTNKLNLETSKQNIKLWTLNAGLPAVCKNVIKR